MREVSSAEGNVERAIRANDVDTLKNVRRCLEKGLAAARKVADVSVKLALYSTPGGGGLVALRDIAKSAGKHTLKIGVTKAVDATESKALQGVYETISKVGRIGTFSVEDIDKLKSIEGLYEERWKMGTIQDRAASLMQLEVQLAQIQGRPPVELVFERMGKNEAGFFDGKQLHVNFEHISNPDYRLEVIDTIGHEGCHAYQEWAITHPGFHPNDAEVKYWAANRLAYFQPKYIGEKFGVEYYRNQPMELHAWPYGRQVQDIYFSPKKPFASFEEMMPDYLRVGITKVQSAHKSVSLGEYIANIKERIENYVQSQLENPKVRHKLKRGMMKLAVKGIQKGLKWWERNGMTITSEAKTIVRAMGKTW